MRNSYCGHTAVVDGEHRGYVAPVHTGGVTQENGAAHGGVSYEQTCVDCRSTRAVNQNGPQFEYGAWLSKQSYVVMDTRVCPICRTGHDRPHCDEQMRAKIERCACGAQVGFNGARQKACANGHRQ